MKFRTEEGDDCSFAFVYYDGNERVRDSRLEKDFEEMLRDAADFENLQFDSVRSAYVISGEQEQFLRGAAAGFCYAANRHRCTGTGYCFARLHTC